MSGAFSNSPMLKAAGLWMKTSAKGTQYFTGRLGGVKVLILENRDRKGDNDPSHNLFFVDGTQNLNGQTKKWSKPQSSASWPAPLTQESPQLPLDADADAPEWAR